jgi:type IV pilus assembly protein PilA
LVVNQLVAAIAIPKFANTTSKAYMTAMKSDLRNMTVAEEAFFSDSSKYSTSLAVINFKQSTGVNAPVITTGPGYWFAKVSHASCRRRCARSPSTRRTRW